jgi:hypothetical protein
MPTKDFAARRQAPPLHSRRSERNFAVPTKLLHSPWFNPLGSGTKPIHEEPQGPGNRSLAFNAVMETLNPQIKLCHGTAPGASRSRLRHTASRLRHQEVTHLGVQVHDSGRSPDLGNRLSNCKLMTRPHGNGYRTRSRYS